MEDYRRSLEVADSRPGRCVGAGAGVGRAGCGFVGAVDVRVDARRLPYARLTHGGRDCGDRKREPMILSVAEVAKLAEAVRPERFKVIVLLGVVRLAVG